MSSFLAVYTGRLDMNRFRMWTAQFGSQVLYVVVKHPPKRQGTQAMRYYRGIVVPDIAKATGITDPAEYPQTHEGLAWKFLRIADGPMGEPRRRSTSKDDMDEREMSTYIDACIMWAETSIPNCRVRRPHEVDWDSVSTPMEMT